ncbi:MAG: hypothetical protein Q8N36_02105, partial [bacterium]|nr:hypothetical protein [bacterium]
ADRLTKLLYAEILFADYAPVIFVSALTGQRVQKIFDLVLMVSEEQNKRVSTTSLNELIQQATIMTPPPAERGKRLKISYSTQVQVKPPTFVLFVNNPELMHFSYLRFLENKIRDVYEFKGTSIKIICRKKS